MPRYIDNNQILFNELYKYIYKIGFIVLFIFCFLNSSYSQKNNVVYDTIITFHKVLSEDNLYRISLKYNVSQLLICKVNNWESESPKIIIGSKVKIPKIIERTITENISISNKEDSLVKYKEYKQRIEDSLFIYIVQRDKIKDSIENYNLNFKPNSTNKNSISEPIKDTVQIDNIKTNKSKIDTIKNIKVVDTLTVINDKNQSTKAIYDDNIEKNKIESSKNIQIDTSEIIKQKDLKTIDVKVSKKNKKYRIGEEVSETDKQKSTFYLARAMKAIDAKEYANAEGFLIKAIDLNPNYTEAYMLHADLFYTINDYTKAIKEYNKAILTDKKMISAYYNRGANYMKLNDLSKSLSDFNTALKLDPEYILALGGRASIYLLKKDYINAINDYNKILELNKYFNPAYKARAIAKIETGDLKGAIEDCTKFLETEPNDAYMLYQRGMARMKDGDIYNSCLDLLKSSEMGYSEATKSMNKFCK